MKNCLCISGPFNTLLKKINFSSLFFYYFEPFPKCIYISHVWNFHWNSHNNVCYIWNIYIKIDLSNVTKLLNQFDFNIDKEANFNIEKQISHQINNFSILKHGFQFLIYVLPILYSLFIIAIYFTVYYCIK